MKMTEEILFHTEHAHNAPRIVVEHQEKLGYLCATTVFAEAEAL